MMKKIISFITFSLLALLLTLSTPSVGAQTSIDIPEEKHEFRAAWASHLIGSMSAYTSEAQFKARATEILDILEYYNFNALIMHMRTHNNAYYVSEINPKAAAFASVNFNTFDPMLWFIEETQKRGMEFHAWLNPYRLGSSHVGSIPQANPASNPDNILSYNGASILNPGLPHVRDFVSETIVEILERYPVDAIHFDDYFYINLGANGATTGSNTILNEPDQQTFETYGAGYNTASASSKADWRRHQVNLMVEAVSNTIKDFNEANDTFVQFGISPTGIYKNGNGVVTYDSFGNPITNGSDTGGQTHYSSYLFADSVNWAKEGWIDYLIPQSYWADSHPIASYTKIMSWWNDVFRYLDVNLYSGIGIYMADSASNTYGWKSNAFEMQDQLTFIQSLDFVQGASIYSYNYVDSAYKNASNYSTTQMKNAENLWSNISILPELRSMNRIDPGTVSNLKIEQGILSFNANPDAKQYYIYRSENHLTFSQDEIYKVIRTKDELISFDTGDQNNNYQYGVRALSYTNTLGAPTIISDLIVTDGAAIRVGTNEDNQALRFYAKIDTSISKDEVGFYIIEGDASIAELKLSLPSLASNNYILNGKKVYKIPAIDLDNDGNFSAIIKDIEPSDFSKLHTAIAYYRVGSEVILSNNLTKRSILDVAVRMNEAGDGNTQTEEIATNILRLTKSVSGNYMIAGNYEMDPSLLKDEFLKDWNQKFGLNLTDIDLNSFYESATFGKVSDIDSLLGSRLYQFFNDQNIILKWNWLLDYVLEIDKTFWASRQVVAVRGDGTNPDYDNIYNGRHLITTMIGFFNQSYAYDGYPTNDFTNTLLYDLLIHYNTQVIAKAKDDIYIYVGDTITLPLVHQNGFSHYKIDGITYQAGDSYKADSAVIIHLVF